MAKNDIKFNIGLVVNGQSAVEITKKSIEETGKAANTATGSLGKMGDSLKNAGKYGEAFTKITESGKPLQRQLREIQ